MRLQQAVLFAVVATVAAQSSTRRRTADRPVEWPLYGGGPQSMRYSSLTQINRANVTHLQVAWTFDASDSTVGTELEVNPIVVDGVLYATTASLNVVALNAATGELLWRFDPYHGRKVRGEGGRVRGVTYWGDGPDQRIFIGVQQFLYALDAKTGRPISTFGHGGRIDMRSEEHTSELQSHSDLVCRLLLEKKK